jgi:hypothetical protein
MVPGGTILAVSASSDGAGVGVAFALAADASLWEYRGGWAELSPAGTILSISAGTHDDVFAVAGDQSLWEFAHGGWRMLSPAGTITAIQAGVSATGADVVFALAGDGSLWEGGAGGWTMLSPASTIAALGNAPWDDLFALFRVPNFGASSNTQREVVFATAWDGSFWEFDGTASWVKLFP